MDICGIFLSYFFIRLSSGITVNSIVIKQALPPSIFDTGSAMNTPFVPRWKAYGSRYVRGTTMIAFLSREKKIACFFLFSDLKVVWPIYCSSINANAAKYILRAGMESLISELSELKTDISAPGAIRMMLQAMTMYITASNDMMAMDFLT